MTLVDFLRKHENKEPRGKWDYSKIRNVRCYSLRRVLEGRHSNLGLSFSWNSTPQGYSYWSVRNAGKPLSSKDLEFLKGLLRYAERQT